MKFPFIEQKDNKVIAKKYIRVIISKQMFEDELAEVIDTDIQTLGFFVMRVSDDASFAKYKDYQVNLPVVIKINAFNATDDSEGKYVTFEPEDVIIESTTYFKRVDSVNKFLNYLIAAKINVNSPEELIGLFSKNAQMNDTRVASQPVVIEAITSELVRWDKDETKPLRLALKDKSVSPKDFKLISIKEISRVTSVFNAISFEDINKSLQSAVIMSRGEKDQIISPVEKILKY
jgi:hypothetical protein